MPPDNAASASRHRRYPWFSRLLTTLIACLLCTIAAAHDARPVAVGIAETLPGVYQAVLKVPATVTPDNQPVLVWPATCVAADDDPQKRLMRCAGGLTGQSLALDYPLFNPSLTTFYRLATLDGDAVSAMLAPSTAAWQVPVDMTAARVARDYLLLGVEHIIGGLDHLLFVLGLLVIARTPRRILLTVTGFTLAHSITLSLSSLGVLVIPIVPVEAAIALSILFLAHEISRGRKDSLTWRFPLLVSFGFGLLHGLGFASALGEIGLVQSEILVSLLFFNLGVEAGQIVFIIAVLGLVSLLHALARYRPEILAGDAAIRRADLLAAYVIGVPSAYWFIDRVAQFAL